MQTPFKQWYELFMKASKVPEDAARKIYENLFPNSAQTEEKLVFIKAGEIEQISWRGNQYNKSSDGTIGLPENCIRWLESISYPGARRGQPSKKVQIERLQAVT